jgi:SAM-dependent methyltransferase
VSEHESEFQFDETMFDETIASRYERLWPELHEPGAIDPVVDVLCELAGDGAALEFGIGTGRIARPLHERGVEVHGIEVSPAMVNRLRELAGVDAIPVTIGDFASTAVGRTFSLVYLIRNTITNLTTQAAQVACFRNAAAHLAPGGCFVVENYVPELQRLPPGETRYLFVATEEHVGYEEYDVSTQLAQSHHYWTIDGHLEHWVSTHRYAWPSELDLMAQLAGLELRSRWADWDGSTFTAASRSHVSIWA